MRNALTYKRLVWRYRRLLIRAANGVGGKPRLVSLSKVLTMLTAGCSIILLVAQGCATTPPPPQPLTQDVRAALGTVGVISVGPQLAGDVSGPVGTGKEAGRGAAKGGAIGGLSGAGIGALAGLTTGPCAPVAVPILAGIGALGGLAVGAGTGAIVRAVNAIPTETADSLEAALSGAMASRDLPADLRRGVLGRVSMSPRQPVDLGASNADPAASPDYTRFAANDVHSVLEITFTEVIFAGEGGRNPSFALSMKAQTRLIRIADNQVIWSREDILFRSPEADVTTWTTSESGHLAAELGNGLQMLAQQISDEVFSGTAI